MTQDKKKIKQFRQGSLWGTKITEKKKIKQFWQGSLWGTEITEQRFLLGEYTGIAPECVINGTYLLRY